MIPLLHHRLDRVDALGGRVTAGVRIYRTASGLSGSNRAPRQQRGAAGQDLATRRFPNALGSMPRRHLSMRLAPAYDCASSLKIAAP